MTSMEDSCETEPHSKSFSCPKPTLWDKINSNTFAYFAFIFLCICAGFIVLGCIGAALGNIWEKYHPRSQEEETGEEAALRDDEGVNVELDSLPKSKSWP